MRRSLTGGVPPVLSYLRTPRHIVVEYVDGAAPCA
jgi:hypothetical protein